MGGTQLAIYERGLGFELERNKKQIQLVVGVGLKSRDQRADHSATLPTCFCCQDNYLLKTAVNLVRRTSQTLLWDNWSINCRIAYEVVNSHCEAGSAIQLAIPISYPTRVNELFLLLNCQPSLIYFYKTFPVIEENSGYRLVRVYCYHCRSRFP